MSRIGLAVILPAVKEIWLDLEALKRKRCVGKDQLLIPGYFLKAFQPYKIGVINGNLCATISPIGKPAVRL